MNRTKAFLQEALNLLNDGKGWTKKTFAANAEGFTVAPFSGEACKWCALGALHATTVSRRDWEDFGRAKTAISLVLERRYHKGSIDESLIEFNDSQENFSPIKKLFEDAIELSGD